MSYEEYFSLEEAQGESHHFLQLKGSHSGVMLVSPAMPALRGPEEMTLREDSD